MRHQFEIGDYVECVATGSGLAPECKGKRYKIAKLGEYFDRPGYWIYPADGNTLSGSHDGFIGENSFALVLGGPLSKDKRILLKKKKK